MKKSDDDPSAMPPSEKQKFLEDTESTESSFSIPNLRYIIVFLGTFAAAIGLSCNFAYNFAVVCGVNGTMDAKGIYDESPDNSPIMFFPASISNMIYSAYPAGNILTLFGLIALRGKVSVKTQVLVGTAVSTITTAMIPFMFDYWPPSTLILKFIQGASVAPTIPLIGHIAAHWTPLAEVGFIIAILSSYSQVGIFITMSTSGVLCESFGWRSIFYFNAACSTVMFILWWIFFADTPAHHKMISTDEFQLIRPNEKQEINKSRPNVPYRKFFTNMSIWAVLIATIGNYNGISPLIVFAPSILKKAVGLTDMATSYYNATSFAMQLFLKVISGILSDRWTSVDESFKTRFFNSISCGLSGLLMMGMAFLPVENKVLCAVAITITQACIGFNSAGFNKAAMIVSKQYAHFTVTLIGVIISASTIAEPFLVWWMAPDTTWNQWFPLLIIHGFALFISNIIFCIFIRARPAPFTIIVDEKKTNIVE